MSRFTMAFVIVGLLAVISIVAYPIFAIAPAYPHKVPCISHLKQSALCLIIYTSDNDDGFPDRDKWVDATLEYAKDPDIYHCPDVMKLNPKQYGYAFNSTLSFAKTPKNSETVPLIYDSINLGRNASDPVNSLPNPPRHKDTINYTTYADGHVQPLKKP